MARHERVHGLQECGLKDSKLAVQTSYSGGIKTKQILYTTQSRQGEHSKQATQSWWGKRVKVGGINDSKWQDKRLRVRWGKQLKVGSERHAFSVKKETKWTEKPIKVGQLSVEGKTDSNWWSEHSWQAGSTLQKGLGKGLNAGDVFLSSKGN